MRAALGSALDVMLTEAAVDQGVVAQFVKPRAVASTVGGLARHPRRVARRAGGFGAELVRVAGGRSQTAPAKRDRRFVDRGWQENWLLHRLLQAYLAGVDTVEGLISDADLDWRSERQARLVAGNVLDALAPRTSPGPTPPY